MSVERHGSSAAVEERRPGPRMADFAIPLRIEERHGLARLGAAIRVGVPFPRGLVREPHEIALVDAANDRVPSQVRPLCHWPDGSIKWLLVDAHVSVAASSRTSLMVRPARLASDRPVKHAVRVTARGDDVDVDTGAARFAIRRAHPGPLASGAVGPLDVFGNLGVTVRMVGRRSVAYEPMTDRVTIEEHGPVRTVVLAEGWFHGPQGVTPIGFKSRMSFAAGSSAVGLDFTIRNARAAVHAGGLWDLGDAGSWQFEDLTLMVHPRESIQRLRWYGESPADEREQVAAPWTLYQDSSGGDNWQSPNHVDHRSQATVTFRGYRVLGASEAIQFEGLRATPGLTAVGPAAWIAVATQDFWQNFPKALRWRGHAVEVALFPGEARGAFELQGGEQKRHSLWIEVGPPSHSPTVALLQRPLAASVDPSWMEASRAIVWFTAAGEAPTAAEQYVHQIVEGPHSFFAKREIVDEYGWRHFGDLFADHEAVGHRGAGPFVSHYNNQYDFVYGAFVQFCATGDARWHRLLDDAARHLIDIDIYHTDGDRAAFNGGLFWHTDHHQPAATCTHRTYSRRNARDGAYGGGPSNEHNYSSGLLHYYYLTGDPEAADAVRGLARWVCAMDDGRQTLFGVIDDGPTGDASRTLESSYHHPGRGAGNSINALLDAFVLSRERPYLTKAEELIERCIHPSDDIAALALDDPERRWSYLVFLQILGKYLITKRDFDELDYRFHYARESLLHYAAWMVEHEVPFKDVLHKVKLPTETWPAHDVRKGHVLSMAADYCGDDRAETFRARARFFYARCLSDLRSFPTAHFTRPLVILCVYGPTEAYFARRHDADEGRFTHHHVFGVPRAFVPQRARLSSSATCKALTVSREVSRLTRDTWSRLTRRLRLHA